MDDSMDGGKLKRDSLGIIIILVALVVIIMMKSSDIKKESATFRNGTVQSDK